MTDEFSFSSNQIIIIFCVIFGVSIILSLIYLFYRVDYKKISPIIFILNVIYASFFVGINITSMFDLMTGKEDQYTKFSKTVSKIYLGFNRVDKILGFLLFNILIYYLESGYYSIIKKIFDGFIRTFDDIKNSSTCKKVLLFGVRLPLLLGILIISIIYRKHFGLKKFCDFINVPLDCYAIYEIYISVGFFIIQLIIDCKRQGSSKLILRYYRYTVIKIINKFESDFIKMKKLYESLNGAVQNLREIKNPNYYKYLKKNLDGMDKKIKDFERASTNNYIRIHDIYNINNNYNNIMNYNNYNNNMIYIPNYNNQYNFPYYNNQYNFPNNNQYNSPNNNYNNTNNIYSRNTIIFNDNNNNNFTYQTNNNFMFSNGINEKMQLSNNINTGIRLMPSNQTRGNRLPPIRKKGENKKEEREENKKEERAENKKEEREENKKKENEKEKQKEENPPETCIRKYKKYIRRSERLKKLNIEIKKETINELNRLNANKKCDVFKICRFIALFIVIITDFLLPITLNKDNDYDYTSSAEEDEELDDNGLNLALQIIICIPVSVLCSSYTVIIIYATKRRRYVTGDFLYDKQINDDISLMKTVQLVCGYSFALIYCNLYFWRSIDTNGHYGRPKFYDETIIPDYTLIRGISIVMILKIVIILLSMFGGLMLSNFSVFKNDLAEYNLTNDFNIYDNDFEFNNFLTTKMNIAKMLNSDN